MLLNDFYTITQKDAATGQAVIAIDPSHKIFGGHFPNHPVVPGVCMMQIIRELAEQFLASKLRIVEGDNLKFLSIINPNDHPIVHASVDWKTEAQLVNVTASLFFGTTIFFKFKGTLQAI